MHGIGVWSPKSLPIVNEAFYVCMYWTRKSRPPKGSRMIVRKPGSPFAVVVAAGHETGPGNQKNIGGTTDATHALLGPARGGTVGRGWRQSTGGLYMEWRTCDTTASSFKLAGLWKNINSFLFFSVSSWGYFDLFPFPLQASAVMQRCTRSFSARWTHAHTHART